MLPCGRQVTRVFSAKSHFRKLLWFLVLWCLGLDTKNSSLRWSFWPADDFSNENKTKSWTGRWLGLFHHSQFGDAFPGESCRSSSQSSSCESQSLWTMSRSPSTSRHVIFTMSQRHFLSLYQLHISFHNDNQGDLACILLISLPSSWLHDDSPYKTDVERWRLPQTVCSFNSGPWTTSGRRRGSSLGIEEIKLIGRLWCGSQSRWW